MNCFYGNFEKGKIKTTVSGNYITNVPTAGRQGRTHDACCFHNSLRARHSSEHCSNFI